MASIDKIYGTKAQRDEFYNWCKKEYPEFIKYFYNWEEEWDWEPEKQFPLTNFPSWIDAILWHNCPIKFVQDRLHEQYSNSLPPEKQKYGKRK